MREIEGRETWQLRMTRPEAHSAAMRGIGREAIICIATHPKAAHTFCYEVCVLRCATCQAATRVFKTLGYLPVKVQRISRHAEAATPAPAHALPDGPSS